MKLGKAPGIAMTTMGLIILSGGILVLICVPSWGEWIADYPAQAALKPCPPEATATKQAVIGVLGPLLEQIGDNYMKAAGYFVGSLMTIVSLALTSAGVIVIKKTSGQTTISTG